MNDRVLITGVGGPAGRSTAEFFLRKGAFVIATDVRNIDDPPAKEFFLSPFADDQHYADALIKEVRFRKPSLLVPTVTEELSKAAQLKERVLELGCEMFISPVKSTEIANDKFKTAQFMLKNGISAPITIEGNAPREIVYSTLGLPCLSKPIFGRGGRGVTVYRTRDALLAESRDGIVFQEFIPGIEYDVNIFAYPAGGVCASVVLKKTVLKDGEVGNALKVEPADRPDIAEFCENIVPLLGLNGPLNFDVRLRNDGTPALLEINARVGGNVPHAVEVLECMYRIWKKEKVAG